MEGVFYDKSDYAGIGLRLLIMLVDTAVLSVMFALIYYSALVLDIMGPQVLYAFVFTSYAYLALLKRSKVRTIAYRLFNTRIVDLAGNPPSIWKMTLRYVFLLGGPFNVLMDLVWLSGERDKQSIRDKFAATYVVKNSAKPIGKGTITTSLMDLFGYSMFFREVSR